MVFDVVVVGAGIVGLSTAMHFLEEQPGARVLVLEKEADIAAHQTSHNSGVIHSGIYYKPGSLKAKLCREGVEQTIDFCERRGIAYAQCGKLLVATNEVERERMASIYARGKQNGLQDIELLDAHQLKAREANIEGVGAIHVPTTGIVSYAQVAREMAKVIVERGGEVRTGSALREVHEDSASVTVVLERETVRAKYLIACAGLMADRVAKLCSLDFNFRIVPFRGEFYKLPDEKKDVIRHLIYPIPDPALPFLGVHLTRTIDGDVIIGPNAVLALKREGYARNAFSMADVMDMVGYGGFWKFIGAHLVPGLREYWNSLSRGRYVQLCQKYCPSISRRDLLPYPSGVRAQAVLPDGKFVEDFFFLKTGRTFHVCNAPSPAATSALPIGNHIVTKAKEVFRLN